LQAFDRQHKLLVEHRHKQDAGIDGAIVYAIACELAYYDGAGAAIAFRTALLGAGETLIPPKVVHKGERWRNAAHHFFPAIQKKNNVLAHGILNMNSIFNCLNFIEPALTLPMRGAANSPVLGGKHGYRSRLEL